VENICGARICGVKSPVKGIYGLSEALGSFNRLWIYTGINKGAFSSNALELRGFRANMPVLYYLPPIYGEIRIIFMEIKPQVIPKPFDFSTIYTELSTGYGRFLALFSPLVQHIDG
jgi:hypothetical protein